MISPVDFMKRILLITGMLFILSACSGQQTQVNDLLKMKTLRYDPAIETGTLNNGFRYFLAENSTPEKKCISGWLLMPDQ